MHNEKEKFAKRLNNALDLVGFPLPGRQTHLAKAVKVKQPAARKWLVGLSYPDDRNLEKLSRIVKKPIYFLKYGYEPDENINAPSQDDFGDQAYTVDYSCAFDSIPGLCEVGVDIYSLPVNGDYVLVKISGGVAPVVRKYQEDVRDIYLTCDRLPPVKMDDDIIIIGVITEIRLSLVKQKSSQDV